MRFGDRHFSLHLIPSGILHPGTRCVLGNGMVIAPDAFFAEIEKLRAAGVELDRRLFVSDRAQVILGEHALLDGQREQAAGGGKIGTTLRGIGPAYETKIGRFGLRVCDLAAADPPDAGDYREALEWILRVARPLTALRFGESDG